MKKNLFYILIILIIGSCKKESKNIAMQLPTSPTGLTAISIDTTRVVLRWTDNSNNEAGFIIQRKSPGGNFEDIGSVGSNVSEFINEGLSSGATYIFRVLSYNSTGNSTAYSNELIVTTIVNLPSVLIGNQIWTTQNLNVSFYKNGDPIPQVTDPNQWENLTTGAWCWFNNDSVNYSRFGKLYNWYALYDPRGISPEGWHVPSVSDWKKLIMQLDSSSDTTLPSTQYTVSYLAGGDLKETGLTHWASPNTGANNNSGFSGIANGYRIGGGLFASNGIFGNYWSITEYSNTNAWYFYLQNNSSQINIFANSKFVGASVRLVKD